MVEEWLMLLPKEVGTLALVLAMGGTLVGAGLWLAGARFSRSLMTLLMVAAGGWVGLYLPTWLAWNIDGWAPAILMAIVLGGSGFVMHRFWVGVGLGAVLAIWAGLGVWTVFRGNGAWAWPTFESGMGWLGYGKSAWMSLPEDMRRMMPIAGALAMVGGLAAALVWPRVGVVMLHSMLGVSMVVGLGSCAMNVARPEWLGALPAKAWVQLVMVLAMVAFGALLQWQVPPGKTLKQGRPMVVVD